MRNFTWKTAPPPIMPGNPELATRHFLIPMALLSTYRDRRHRLALMPRLPRSELFESDFSSCGCDQLNRGYHTTSTVVMSYGCVPGPWGHSAIRLYMLKYVPRFVWTSRINLTPVPKIYTRPTLSWPCLIQTHKNLLPQYGQSCIGSINCGRTWMFHPTV